MPGVDRGPDSRLKVLLLVCLLRLLSLLVRYKFRIKAENAYGISDESEESDPFDVNQPLSGKDPWFVLRVNTVFVREPFKNVLADFAR